MPGKFYLAHTIGIFLLFCSATSAIFAKDKNAANFLDFEKISYSQITPVRDVAVVHRDGGKICLLPPRQRQVLQTAFTPEDARFMAASTLDVADAESFLLDESIPTPAWSGLFPIHNGMTLLIDGLNLAVASFEPTRKWSLVSHRNIVVDLFRPTSDSRGEPTRVETTAARKKLATEMKPLRGEKNIITGAVALPAAWAGKKEPSYLLLTRLPSFPLVTMRCEQADSTQCQIERACFVQGFPPKEAAARQGLAISEKRQWLIVGNRERQSLQIYQFKDCFHITLAHEIELPEQLRKLRSVFVDAEDNLWLSTEGADDFRNASVYMWAAKDW